MWSTATKPFGTEMGRIGGERAQRFGCRLEQSNINSPRRRLAAIRLAPWKPWRIPIKARTMAKGITPKPNHTGRLSLKGEAKSPAGMSIGGAALNRNQCGMPLVRGKSKSREESRDRKNCCRGCSIASFVEPGAGINQSRKRSGCHFGPRCRHLYPLEFATGRTTRNSSPAGCGARPEPVHAGQCQPKRAGEKR